MKIFKLLPISYTIIIIILMSIAVVLQFYYLHQSRPYGDENNIILIKQYKMGCPLTGTPYIVNKSLNWLCETIYGLYYFNINDDYPTPLLSRTFSQYDDNYNEFFLTRLNYTLSPDGKQIAIIFSSESSIKNNPVYQCHIFVISAQVKKESLQAELLLKEKINLSESAFLENQSINNIAWSHSGKMIACSIGNTVDLINVGDNKIHRSFRTESSILSLSWSSDDSILATGNKNKEIVLYDIKKGKHIKKFFQKEEIIEIKFDIRGSFLAVVDKGAQLNLLSTKNYESVFKWTLNSGEHFVWDINSNYLILTTNKKEIIFFDCTNLKEVSRFQLPGETKGDSYDIIPLSQEGRAVIITSSSFFFEEGLLDDNGDFTQEVWKIW